MIARNEMRKLSSRFLDASFGRMDEALVSVTAKDARDAASVLSTPTWFSAFELLQAADAMDILNLGTADAWTLRKRLDDFAASRPAINNAGAFAAYLRGIPNGGQE